MPRPEPTQADIEALTGALVGWCAHPNPGALSHEEMARWLWNAVMVLVYPDDGGEAQGQGVAGPAGTPYCWCLRCGTYDGTWFIRDGEMLCREMVIGRTCCGEVRTRGDAR